MRRELLLGLGRGEGDLGPLVFLWSRGVAVRVGQAEFFGRAAFPCGEVGGGDAFHAVDFNVERFATGEGVLDPDHGVRFRSTRRTRTHEAKARAEGGPAYLSVPILCTWSRWTARPPAVFSLRGHCGQRKCLAFWCESKTRWSSKVRSQYCVEGQGT